MNLKYHTMNSNDIDSSSSLYEFTSRPQISIVEEDKFCMPLMYSAPSANESEDVMVSKHIKLKNPSKGKGTQFSKYTIDLTKDFSNTNVMNQGRDTSVDNRSRKTLGKISCEKMTETDVFKSENISNPVADNACLVKNNRKSLRGKDLMDRLSDYNLSSDSYTECNVYTKPRHKVNLQNRSILVSESGQPYASPRSIRKTNYTQPKERTRLKKIDDKSCSVNLENLYSIYANKNTSTNAHKAIDATERVKRESKNKGVLVNTIREPNYPYTTQIQTDDTRAIMISSGVGEEQSINITAGTSTEPTIITPSNLPIRNKETESLPRSREKDIPLRKREVNTSTDLPIRERETELSPRKREVNTSTDSPIHNRETESSQRKKKVITPTNLPSRRREAIAPTNLPIRKKDITKPSDLPLRKKGTIPTSDLPPPKREIPTLTEMQESKEDVQTVQFEENRNDVIKSIGGQVLINDIQPTTKKTRGNAGFYYLLLDSGSFIPRYNVGESPPKSRRHKGSMATDDLKPVIYPYTKYCAFYDNVETNHPLHTKIKNINCFDKQTQICYLYSFNLQEIDLTYITNMEVSSSHASNLLSKYNIQIHNNVDKLYHRLYNKIEKRRTKSMRPIIISDEIE